MPLTRDFDLLRSTISELQKCLDVQKDPSAGQVGINASRQRMTPRQSAETNRYIFRKRPNGFAYCKVLYKNGIPDDLLYLNVNETFKTLTGLKDVVGKRITEVIPGIKEIDTKLFDIYSRVVMTAQSETFEVYDKISGQWFSVSIYSPERDRIAFIFDVITDRKETEFALDENLKSLSQLTNLLDISSQPFAQGYLDGRVGLYNQAFLDLTGYSREEFSKINWATDLTPPEWMPFEIEKLTELTNTSQPVRYEKEYIRKDGSRIPVEVFAHLVRDDDGNPKFYYAFFTDITERKRAEKERHIALTKYKVLFDTFPLGITVADRSGQILESNQMAEKLLGLSPEEHKQRQIDGHEWQIIRTDGTLMPAEEYASVRALKEKKWELLSPPPRQPGSA